MPKTDLILYTFRKILLKAFVTKNGMFRVEYFICLDHIEKWITERQSEKHFV